MRIALPVVAVLTGAVVSLAAAAPADAAFPTRFTGDGIRIRSCADTSCAVLGLGYRSHSVTDYCWVAGTPIGGNDFWDRIRDNTTGVTGYVNETYLRPIAPNHC